MRAEALIIALGTIALAAAVLVSPLVVVSEPGVVAGLRDAVAELTIAKPTLVAGAGLGLP